VLNSVHYEGIRGRIKIQNGSESSDTVKITVPITVSGGVYVSPKAFSSLTNKTGYFTFNEEDTIVKGDVASSILFADLEMLYDDVVVITTIDIADYGSTWMQHIELLCR
jgi:hypothetical protein